MSAKTLRFARSQMVRSRVGSMVVTLLFVWAGTVWSAGTQEPQDDPFTGQWGLTYHLTTKPGHETYVNPASGATVVQKAFVTHVSQPGFTVNSDGTFALGLNDTGSNRNEEDHNSPAGPVQSRGKWQAYLKVSEGKVDVDGEVVRLTLQQALGSGTARLEWPGTVVQTNYTTLPDSDSGTLVNRHTYGTDTRQFPRGPGGYTQTSGWGSQEWLLKKTSTNGNTTIYSASKDVQLGGGLLVVETVQLQQKKSPDLEVAFEGAGAISVPPDGLLDVNALITNVGDVASIAAELEITFQSSHHNAISELLDAGTGIGNGHLIESTNDSVTFRVGRLEPGDFTNAIVRFRVRLDRRDNIFYEALRQMLEAGNDLELETEVRADVSSTMDTNDSNNHAAKPITLRGKTAPKK